ncbi:unnamed protein product [Heterobilharzia americana]|nr:unnamed protein product [Heterobilharzia americana]
MDYIWFCEYCSPNDLHDGRKRFVTQKEFVNHIRLHHLVQRTENDVEIFICRYGPNNSCLFLSQYPNDIEDGNSSRGSLFTNQCDYEKHLVGFHLIKHPVYKNLDSKSLQPIHHVTPHCNEKPSRKWSVYKSVVNLPAILNDPNYREVDIFSRLWGDKFENVEVYPVHIYQVDANSHTSSPKCQINSFWNSSSVKSSNKVSSNEKSPDTSLSSIPALYFDSTFNLKDEKTFCQVIPLHPRRLNRNSVEKIDYSSSTLTTTSVDISKHLHYSSKESYQKEAFRVQHDQLVNYLDIVELNIAEQVSKKSSTFFEAIQCHDVIREDLSQAIRQIKEVRHKLHHIDTLYTSDKMRLLRVVRRRENYQLLVDKLKLIASLRATQPTIQSLLRNNDFCAALDLVSTTKDLLQSHLMGNLSSDMNQTIGKHSNLEAGTIELNKNSNTFICLRDFSAQLSGISNFVHKMVESEFEMSLCRFLDPPVEEYRGYNEPDILSCFLGLIRINRLDFVSGFHAEMIKRVKDIFSQHISSVTRPPGNDYAIDSSAITGSTTFPTSDQLRNLSFEEWMRFLVNLCNDLKYLLIRGQDVVEIFETNLCSNEPSKVVENCDTNSTSSSLHQSMHTITVSKAKELAKRSNHSMESKSITPVTGIITSSTAAGMVTTNNLSHISSMNSPNQQKRLSTMTISMLNTATTPIMDIRFTTTFSEYAFDKVNWSDFRKLVKILSTFQVYVLRAWLKFSDILVEAIIYSQLEDSKNHVRSNPYLSSSNKFESNPKKSTVISSPRNNTTVSNTNGCLPNNQYVSSIQSDLVLRNLVLSMIKLIIDRFHRDKCEKLNILLDQERWQAATCPEQVQQMIDDMSFEVGQCKSKDLVYPSHIPNHNTSTVQLHSEEGKTQNHIFLNGEQYIVVGTVVLLLPMINEYIKLDEKLPSQPLATEFILDRLADLLNHFNSRACQLVLGAEACEKVDLQRISAKNLALTLRSLQLIVHFLPCIRVSLERISKLDFKKISDNEDNFLITSLYQTNLGLSRIALNDLDHIEKLYKDHIESVLQKLVELLSDPIGPSLSTWYGRPPIPSREMTEICRNLSKLTGMTGHVLPAKILTSILLRVHNELKVQLRHRISELGIVADGGPQQSLVDSEMLFYIDHLQTLTPQLHKFVDDCSDIWPS